MNALEFLQNINNIDNKFIIEANTKQKKISQSKNKNLIKIIAAVACVVAIIGIAIFAGNILSIPVESSTPVQTYPPTSEIKSVSNLTKINVTSRMSYSTDNIEIEEYINLEGDKLEVFNDYLKLFVVISDSVNTEYNEIQLTDELLQLIEQNAIYFYDELTDTQICIFDSYIYVIKAGDVSASTGIYKMNTESYDFDEYFAIYFD